MASVKRTLRQGVTVHALKLENRSAASKRWWSCCMAKTEVFRVGKAGRAGGRRHDGIGCGVDEPCSHAKFQNPANAECLVFRAR